MVRLFYSYQDELRHKQSVDNTKVMKKNRLNLKSILKIGLWVTVVVFAVAGISILVYAGYLAKKIEGRFAGRRWNIPSAVYSDSTLLYPGQAVNRPLLNKKLKRLGYREVSHIPGRKGEMRYNMNSVDIFLHDFKSPFLMQIGFPVRIRFKDQGIVSIVHKKTGETMPLMELEPEELMRFYGPDRERRRLGRRRYLLLGRGPGDQPQHIER